MNNKYRKATIIVGLFFVLVGLCFCIRIKKQRIKPVCKKQIPSEYKELGIKEYIYPKKFKMGKNLKNAISQYMEYNDEYYEDMVNKEDWLLCFDRSLVSSARKRFDYIDSVLKNRKDNTLSQKEMGYLNYSFTGRSVPVPDDTGEYRAYQHSDYGFVCVHSERIMNYEVRSEKKDRVHLIAKYNYYSAHSNLTKPFKTGEYDIVLQKNPYSCYDGYSIKRIKRVNEKYTAHLGEVYTIKVYYDEENEAFRIVELPDEIQGKEYVALDLTTDSNIKKYIEEHKGDVFEIEFKLDKHEEAISELKPVSVKTCDQKD